MNMPLRGDSDLIYLGYAVHSYAKILVCRVISMNYLESTDTV